MFKILFALHLLFAVFAIGPLVHAATTAGRAVRRGDRVAAASAARLLRIYSYASVLVVVFGFALMSQDSPFQKGKKVGEFGDTWVWLSLVLWLIAVALALVVIVPSLEKTGQAAEQQPASALTARVAAAGGVVGVIFAVVVFLMVYRPGD